MPIEYPPPDNAYVLDPESETEMVRLQKQDRILTQAMGGLFPERPEGLAGVEQLLDVGCGPAGWTLCVAHDYPKVRVTGIDISERMIRYARTMAKAQWLENTTEFRVMDVTQPLAFADNSFDLVNARLITAFMNTKQWPSLLRECWRVLRPGGTIRLMESDVNVSNSPAANQFLIMWTTLLWKAGKSFAPEERGAVIGPSMRQLLRTAGFTRIQQRAYAVEIQPEMDGYSLWMENFQIGVQSLQATFVKLGLITDEEFERLYRQAYLDMLADDFCWLSYYISMWGSKGKKD